MQNLLEADSLIVGVKWHLAQVSSNAVCHQEVWQQASFTKISLHVHVAAAVPKVCWVSEMLCQLLFPGANCNTMHVGCLPSLNLVLSV